MFFAAEAAWCKQEIMSEFIDFSQLVRPNSPNTYLVAPPGLCLQCEADCDSPVFDLSPENLFGRLLSVIEANKSWRLAASHKGEGRACFVAVTPVLRFKDDVDVAVLPGPRAFTSQIAIYSRSRVGYADLGANQRRVEALLEALQSSSVAS